MTNDAVEHWNERLGMMTSDDSPKNGYSDTATWVISTCHSERGRNEVIFDIGFWDARGFVDWGRSPDIDNVHLRLADSSAG